MRKEIITFGDIKIKKHEFQRYQNPIFLETGNIDNVFISSNKISSGEKSYKYVIGYLHNGYEIKSLHVVLPKNQPVT